MTKHKKDYSPHITFEEYKMLTVHQRIIVNRLRKEIGLKSHHAGLGQPSPHRGKPHPSKGKPRYNTRGVPKPSLRRKRPERWISGTDPARHEKYDPYLKAKAQANFRGEGWDMTFDEFEQLWGDLWYNRGRDADNNCMTRIDWNAPWTFDNCEIITRLEQLQRQGQSRKDRGVMRRAR